jgi:hypothetical protein
MILTKEQITLLRHKVANGRRLCPERRPSCELKG